MNYASIREAAKESHDKRQRHHPAKRRDGGAVHTDEKQDRALIKSMLAKEEKKEKRADGGAVQGRARGGRADRPHKGAGKTTVNIVMPPAGGSGAMAMPPRPMMPPGAAAMPPGAGMPPRPPMAPPQGGMAPMPPGAPPPGMMPPRARGGRMTAGAGSGMGRIEKAEGRKGWIE